MRNGRARARTSTRAPSSAGRERTYTLELSGELADQADALRERLGRLRALRPTLATLGRDGLLVLLLGSALRMVERLELGDPVPEDLQELGRLIVEAGRRRRVA